VAVRVGVGAIGSAHALVESTYPATATAATPPESICSADHGVKLMSTGTITDWFAEPPDTRGGRSSA